MSLMLSLDLRITTFPGSIIPMARSAYWLSSTSIPPPERLIPNARELPRGRLKVDGVNFWSGLSVKMIKVKVKVKIDRIRKRADS